MCCWSLLQYRVLLQTCVARMWHPELLLLRPVVELRWVCCFLCLYVQQLLLSLCLYWSERNLYRQKRLQSKYFWMLNICRYKPRVVKSANVSAIKIIITLLKESTDTTGSYENVFTELTTGDTRLSWISLGDVRMTWLTSPTPFYVLFVTGVTGETPQLLHLMTTVSWRVTNYHNLWRLKNAKTIIKIWPQANRGI